MKTILVMPQFKDQFQNPGAVHAKTCTTIWTAEYGNGSWACEARTRKKFRPKRYQLQRALKRFEIVQKLCGLVWLPRTSAAKRLVIIELESYFKIESKRFHLEPKKDAVVLSVLSVLQLKLMYMDELAIIQLCSIVHVQKVYCQRWELVSSFEAKLGLTSFFELLWANPEICSSHKIK